jgi:hypothetical protein
MYRALSIADNLQMASIIDAKFTEAGWMNEVVSFNTIILGNSNAGNGYHCIVLVVDNKFVSRFGSAIKEMTSIVKKLSKCAPLYLVFEGEYDQCYESWLTCAKKIYKSDLYENQLQITIDEIVSAESRAVSRESFISPMG